MGDLYPADSYPRFLPATGGIKSIVTVCGLYEHKGVFDLVRIFRQLVESDPLFRLTFVGDGPSRLSLEDEIAKLSLSEHVDVLGFRHDVKHLIRQASVFVLLSRSEPAGLVLAEAREVGTPIVATDVDGIPSMVSDGRCAVLVPVGDDEKTAAAIAHLVEDQEARDAQLASSRRTLSELGLPRLIEELDEVYRYSQGIRL